MKDYGYLFNKRQYKDKMPRTVIGEALACIALFAVLSALFVMIAWYGK